MVKLLTNVGSTHSDLQCVHNLQPASRFQRVMKWAFWSLKFFALWSGWKKNCNKDDTYTQREEADIVSVQLTFSQLTCPSGNACDLKQDVKHLRVLMRCFRAAFSVYESLYMCFSANTLPHFFGLIKFFFGSWLSEKWKMPLTPHSLGLHKLLGLFSPAVRPIINRSVLDAFVWISYSLQIQEICLYFLKFIQIE